MLLLVPVGACIGYTCLFLLARGYLVTEYLVFGNWRDAWEQEQLRSGASATAMYGGLIGSLLTPAVFATLFRQLPAREFIKLFSVMAGVATVSGIAGGAYGPVTSSLLAAAGFIGACAGVSAYVRST